MSSREAPTLEALRTFTFEPAGSPRGAAVFLHGHGDYSSRYETILEPFLSRGIVCLATDLPGHGESPGKRGFIPGVAMVDQVTAANLAQARELCPAGPIGLLGHSAGALLALREALHHPDSYDFAWFSSPLLKPESTRHPLVVAFLRHVARWLPNLSLSTGVTANDCWHSTADATEEDLDQELFHNRISLRWGTELIEIAREVREGFPASPLRIPVLFTQGTADPVCPAGVLRTFLEKTAFPAATHLEFQDQLHEPFVDEGREEVLAAVGRWLETVLADKAW